MAQEHDAFWFCNESKNIFLFTEYDLPNFVSSFILHIAFKIYVIIVSLFPQFPHQICMYVFLIKVWWNWMFKATFSIVSKTPENPAADPD